MKDLKSKKILFINFLKGIGILFVIIGHSIQYTDKSFSDNIIYDLIYKFHMPLFFFIAGTNTKHIYFFKELLQNIRSRINRILYPYFIWTFIFYGLIKYFSFFGFKILFQFNFAILWFFPVLFFISFFSLLVIYFYNNRYFFCIFLLILFFLSLNYFDEFWIKSISYYLIFFLLGFKFKKLLISDFRIKILHLFLLITLFIILNYLFLFFSYNSIFLILLKIIFLFTIIIILKFLFDRFNSFKFICNLGEITLEVYILHIFLIFIFNALVDLNCINYLILSLYILILTLLIIFFYKKNSNLSGLFFKNIL